MNKNKSNTALERFEYKVKNKTTCTFITNEENNITLDPSGYITSRPFWFLSIHSITQK